jgi:hypothetical protein
MRRYVASNESWRHLRFPLIVLVGTLGVGGWIANANWSNQDPDELAPSANGTARVTSKLSLREPALIPTPERRGEPAIVAAPPLAARKVAALPPAPVPANAATSGSRPSATAAVPNKTAAPPKPKEPSALATMQAQIAQMKAALKLTREQEPYWPPVEALLRDIARQQAKLRPAAAPAGAHGKPIKMIIHDADMQRLTSVAFPLLMTLREEQRRDALRLAQAMGFETAGAY